LVIAIDQSEGKDAGGDLLWVFTQYITGLPSPNIVRVIKSRRMRWVGHVARMREERGVHRVLVGKPEGKRSLGRPRRKWEDNIKMDVQEVGGGSWGLDGVGSG
jgi:hypothetical protein